MSVSLFQTREDFALSGGQMLRIGKHSKWLIILIKLIQSLPPYFSFSRKNVVLFETLVSRNARLIVYAGTCSTSEIPV